MSTMLPRTPRTLPATRWAWRLLAVLLLAAAAGCSAPPPQVRYHQLTGAPPVPAAQGKGAGGELVVEPVHVPEGLERPQFVMRHSDTQLQVLDRQRWVSSLPDQLTRVLVSDLQAELPQHWVRASDAASAGRLDAGATRLTLRVDVDQLYLGPGTQVELQATWALLDARERVQQRERSTVRLDAAEPGPPGVAAAVSAAVARLAAEVAARVRQGL